MREDINDILTVHDSFAVHAPNAVHLNKIIRRELGLMYLRSKSEIKKRKAADAIAPNYVHSLDASHLARTVNARSVMAGTAKSRPTPRRPGFHPVLRAGNLAAIRIPSRRRRMITTPASAAGPSLNAKT